MLPFESMLFIVNPQQEDHLVQQTLQGDIISIHFQASSDFEAAWCRAARRSSGLPGAAVAIPSWSWKRWCMDLRIDIDCRQYQAAQSSSALASS